MDSDEILKAELQKALAECQRLRGEIAQLRLRVHQSTDTLSPKPKKSSAHDDSKAPSSATVTSDSRPEVKVSLFRSLFRGRDDVYAVRWEGRNGKTGYSPAGIREWDQSRSTQRGRKQSFHYNKLFPVSDEVIRDHLLGRHTIGVYPLLQDDTCWFVAVDFDKKSWQADAHAFLKMCHEAGVPAALERSRSGNGAHVWIFFSSPIQAALARKLALRGIQQETLGARLLEPLHHARFSQS
jgi:hypothetical protein